jgi:hypothetical protein
LTRIIFMIDSCHASITALNLNLPKASNQN